MIFWVISAISLILSVYTAAALGLNVGLELQPWWKILLGTALLGLVNATIGTIAKLVTAPLNCLTFGLAWLLINAALFYAVGQFDLGFHVGDFWGALVGSILMGLVLGILRGLTRDEASA